MLLGLILPTAGRVTVLGIDVVHHRHLMLPNMNFSSPYIELPKRLTVAENLKVFARLYGVPDIHRRIDRLADDLDMRGYLNRPTSTLSAGEKTRVSLAKALINEPEVLLLDEPTASLDPDTADWVRAYLERYRDETGPTILMASHNMLEVERLCDSVIMMQSGRIVDRGTPAELIARHSRQTLEQVFLDIARRRVRSRSATMAAQ